MTEKCIADEDRSKISDLAAKVLLALDVIRHEFNADYHDTLKANAVAMAALSDTHGRELFCAAYNQAASEMGLVTRLIAETE